MQHSVTETKATVYRPNMRQETGWLRTWGIMGRNVWSARELIWQLFRRDFVGAYKKSFIGLVWIVLTPLIGIVTWVFLQAAGMLNPGNVGIPYGAYVLVGTSMWALFMGFFEAGSSTLQAGESLVMQVSYPHEVLLFKQTAQQVANFVIALALNLVALVCFGVTPSWGVLLLPAVALPLFFLGSAVGLVVSMVSVVAVDISRFVSIGLRFLMFATPVIYSDQIQNPIVREMVRWNPLTYLVCSCRDIVVYGALYHPKGYFLASLLSVVAFALAWRAFYVSEDKLIERMI
jgi:lipopolysaccharide transport system permease protein